MKNSKIKKINDFIENKLLAKKFEPFLFLIYTLIVLIILKFDIEQLLLSMEYLSYLVIGVIALKAGVMGIRDKDLWSRTVKMSKKESITWGYMSLLISILGLFMLYYQIYIYGT